MMTTQVASSPAPAPAPAQGHDADTYGWDTVFALNFTHANQAIVTGWPNVNAGAKNFSQTASDDPSFNLNGVFGPWQLTVGGDGKNVRMACPVLSGTYNAGGKAISLTGTNTQVVIEIGMEWVPNPDQFAFVINDGATIAAITADLDANRIDAPLKSAFQSHGKPLSAAATATLVTKGKDWLITDGTVNYYAFYTTDKDNNQFLSIYQFEQGWSTNLKALKDAVSQDDPAVSIIQIINNPATGIAAAVLPDLLSAWFNTNIGEFNHVFSVLDLSPVIAQQTNYTWMLPTSTSYAVTDQGTLDTSIFGVLTMVQNNQPGENHQVSPYAIPSGADAGFLISGPNFMRYMMLGGAQTIFNNAPASSFVITNDGLTVQNKDRILFGKFHMDDSPTATLTDSGYSAQLDQSKLPPALIDALFNQANIDVSNGYKVEVTQAGSQWLFTTGSDDTTEWIVNKDGGNLQFFKATSLWVEAGNFQMSLNHSWVQIQFIDVTYPANSDYDTHVTYSENVPLSLKTEGGKQIFWMQDSFARSLNVNVTETQAAITREIVEGAVFAALSLLAIAGPIIDGLSASTEVLNVAEDGGNALVDEQAFEEAAENNPEANAQNEENAANAAAQQSGGRWTNIKNAFQAPRWKFVGWLAALSGSVVGIDKLVDEILKNAAINEWEKVPGFDDFAETAIKPYSFTGVPGFSLNSAALAGSLQMGFNVSTSGASGSTVKRSA